MTEQEELQLKIRDLEKEVARLHSQIKTQRYGLTWLDVPEGFETDSEDKIPILTEVKDKAINCREEACLFSDTKAQPPHILIEGDNYHALTCLNYTHRGKIDVIYIDPPYNTGNDGFTYKDKRFLKEFPDGTPVPVDSPLRHSYWLSFMSKRLELAKNLLSDKGVIFISIDDNEQANLKLLCDEVFGDMNHIATLPTIMNLKGNQDEFGFAGTHEYTEVYANNIRNASVNNFNIDDESISDWLEDETGYYKKGATLKRTGQDAPRENRPYGFFPILVNNITKSISTISLKEYEKIYTPKTKEFNDVYLKELNVNYSNKGYSFLLPITDNKAMSWRWGRDKVENESNEIIIVGEMGNFSLYKKQRPEIGDLPSKKPKSIFYKPEYSSGNGTAQLKDIFSDKVFNNPKPLELIKDFIHLGSRKSSTILDFFAGSGTTMHATMKLNEEDGGTRQCILVQQKEGENNICEDVTYERNRRVMCGYTNAKGEQVKGLGGSMKYYKTDFVGKHRPKEATDEDCVVLSQKAGCLLALAENTLEEIETTTSYQLFSDVPAKRSTQDLCENQQTIKYTAVYFAESLTHFEEFVNEIQTLCKTSSSISLSVYIFSWGNGEEFMSNFADLPNVTIKTIPQPILEIYKTLNQ